MKKRVCPKCNTINLIDSDVCSNCGYHFKKLYDSNGNERISSAPKTTGSINVTKNDESALNKDGTIKKTTRNTTSTRAQTSSINKVNKRETTSINKVNSGSRNTSSIARQNHKENETNLNSQANLNNNNNNNNQNLGNNNNPSAMMNNQNRRMNQPMVRPEPLVNPNLINRNNLNLNNQNVNNNKTGLTKKQKFCNLFTLLSSSLAFALGLLLVTFFIQYIERYEVNLIDTISGGFIAILGVITLVLTLFEKHSLSKVSLCLTSLVIFIYNLVYFIYNLVVAVEASDTTMVLIESISVFVSFTLVVTMIVGIFFTKKTSIPQLVSCLIFFAYYIYTFVDEIIKNRPILITINLMTMILLLLASIALVLTMHKRVRVNPYTNNMMNPNMMNNQAYNNMNMAQARPMMNNNQGNMSEEAAHPLQNEIYHHLEELKKMLDSGKITREEYEIRKRKYLDEVTRK